MRQFFIIAAAALFACSCTTRVIETRLDDLEDVMFSWKTTSSRPGLLQESYRITVAQDKRDLRKGKNLVWDSAEVLSGESAYIQYDGPKLKKETDYYWKVDVRTNQGSASGRIGHWRSGMGVWVADWIGIDGEIVAGPESRTVLPARYLRKDFKVDRRMKNATLYICGLGSFECLINGKQVSDDIFGTHPTWFPVSAGYLTYDVTDLIRRGDNTIGVVLGNGMFYGMRNWSNCMFGMPRLIAELHIEYGDGHIEKVLSDTTWTATDEGPVRADNIYDGETYDARMELGDWSKPGYTCGWKRADLLEWPCETLRRQLSPAMKIQERLAPKEIRRTDDGRIIVDMGQNMVGWLRVTLRGREGQPVQMRFAEVMDSDSPDSLYFENLITALVTDTYIPAKDGNFTWSPSFVYHGFRFAEISGLDYTPDAGDICGEVFYDEMPTIGTFECSNEMLTRIHRNAYWGIRGNYHGFPSDCPQRSERMGWLGDHATGCYGEAFIFDNSLLYNKWLLDIEESQGKNGDISSVCPRYWTKYKDDITWPSMFIYGADMIRRHFGNETAIRNRYPAMKKWVDHVIDVCMKDDIVVKDHYGDWCLPPESLEIIRSKDSTRLTAKAVISTPVFRDILGKMQEFAVIAGHPEDAPAYRDLAARMKDAFNAKYFDPERGCYDNNTVTANLLGLRLGMVPDGFESRVMDNIVDQTMNRWDGHLNTGLVGTQQIMRGLTENGRVDMAYYMATTDTYPSWGYMVKEGATTIWELWNGNTAAPDMNSRNHVMLLGDLIIWIYENLAGIRCADGSKGFKRIEMKPYLPEGLDWVKASYKCPYGTISSHWKREQDRFTWDVVIPSNTTAHIVLPDGKEYEAGSGAHHYSALIQ